MNNCKELLSSLCEKHGVRELYSFGSRSKEVFDFVNGSIPEPGKSSSDIDIGVRYRRGHEASPEMRVKLTLELEDLFAGAAVDLVVLDEAPPFLALDIIRGEILYAEDLDDQARYELYVLARAGDLMYYERERRKNLLSVKEYDGE